MAEKEDVTSDVLDTLEAQVSAQGVGVITVKDGTLLLFTRKTLVELLQKADGSCGGRVLVLVKHSVPS